MSRWPRYRLWDSWRACERVLGALRIGVCVLAVSSCGVDSGGTGATPASSASGPITGFGSVMVNGVHFDDTFASITDADGAVHRPDELKLGMTADIKGTAVVVAANGFTSTATSIVFGSALLGPIDRMDAAGSTLEVLGQPVAVTVTTVFDAALSGGLAVLSVGDVVEVYALFDAATKRYTATRVERRNGVLTYHLRGVVSLLDTAGKAFSLGNLRVSYAGLPTSELPPALAEEQFVRVQMQINPTSGGWQATKVQDSEHPLEDLDDTRVEALISSFSSPAQFSVDGIVVDASGATFPTGTAGLGLGARVAVEGVASGGVLTASSVQIKTDVDVVNEGFELDGAILTMDAAGQTFVVRDITIHYSGSVTFVNGTISDLAPGKSVAVMGSLSADGTGLDAILIRFGP